MDIITENCPHCGEPNACELEDPGEHDWECMRCEEIFQVRYHTPKNAILVTEDETLYYDHDGKSEKLKDKDKDDVRAVFDKVKKVKPVGRIR